MSSFSQRHNYAQPPEIRLREELPSALRRPISDIAKRRVGSAKELQAIRDKMLDPYGLKLQPLSSVDEWIRECHWFQVYDFIEAVHERLVLRDKHSGIPVEGAPHAPGFEHDINQYFVHEGIGWQLVNGHVVSRGPEEFENTVKTAIGELSLDGRSTAAGQIHEALQALSRRPTPNLRGAIIHGMGALECIVRDLSGKHKLSFGEVLKKRPDLLPKPVDEAISQLWGFASNEARHVTEGREPNRDDAELIVGLAAAVATYLTRKSRGPQ